MRPLCAFIRSAATLVVTGAAAISFAANQPPAVALTSPTPPTTFTAPATILLQAAASDLDGTIAKIEFYRGLTKLGQTTVAPYIFSWSGIAAGSYSLTAKATDNGGASTVSTPISITVNAPPRVSLTAPKNGAVVSAPATVVLRAAASDADGAITKVAFFNGAAKLGEATASPYQFAWTGVAAGNYTLTAIATDNAGATTTSAPVALTAKTPPGVTLTAPVNGTVAMAPATVLLQATAAVASGSIAKVEFFRANTKIGESTTAPYQLNWANVAAGTYSLTAKATDNAGIATTSAASNFIVNTAPVVAVSSPIIGAVINFPGTVTIKATASDPGGSVAKVEFFNGPTKLGEVTKTPFQFAWIGATAGTYSLTARATDNLGATTTSAPVSVIVNAPPQVALTAPGAGTVVIAPASVTLQTATSDPDGTVAKVEFFDGKTKLGESLAAPFLFNWANVAAGTHTLTAKATDNRGAVTTSLAVTLVANAPPAAKITLPANNAVITAPATITIKATATDAGGSIAKVEFFNGPTKLGEDPTAPYQFTWAGVSAGNYSLTAKATDNLGATTTSTPVNVIVNAPPMVTLSSPASGAIVTTPATFILQASATDSDGTIAKVEFFKGSTKLGESTTAPYQFTWAGVTTGTYSLTVKATDNLGASTTSAAVTVNANALPTVKLTSPTATQKLVAPATVALKATASDSGGTVAKVEFFNGAFKLGEATASPYQLSWPGVAAGTYSLTAVATDNFGAKTTSTPVAVLVNAPPSVSLTAPVSGTIVTAPSTVTLQAAATDSDGTVAKVEFYRGQTKIGQATTTPFQLNWNPAAGTYSLTARATDDQGTATTSAPVTLVVNALPTVKITAPANNAKFTSPANIAITANASDSDGTLAKVEFLNGPEKIGEALAAPFQFIWSGVGPGNYSLTAKATDNQGAIATSAAVAIKISAPTGTPTITVTAPPDNAVVAANTPLTLSALASGFTNTVAKVEFFNGTTKLGDAAAVSGQPGTYALSLPAGLPAGTYSLTARATDNTGTVTNSAASTLVVNAPPTIALTSPAAGAVFAAPATVALAADASDSDGTVAKVEFFRGSMKLGESTTTPYQFSAADLPAGSYIFTARATDNRGAVTISSGVAVVVDVPPAITLTAPDDGSIVAAPASITIAATASDPDGSVAKVEFFNGVAKLGQATAAPYQFAWSAVPAGTYTITAVATDNLGRSTTSSPIAIVVDAPPSVALTSPVNNSVVAGPASIALAATAGDTDGTVAKVEFFQGNTKLGEAATAPYQLTWSGVGSGNYSLTAVATDDLGVTSTSAVVAISVDVAPNNVLTVNGGDTTLTAPASVALEVSTANSTSPIARVEFFRDGVLVGTATSPSAPATYAFNEPSPLAPGIYVYRTRVYDSLGFYTDSASIAVTVLAGLPYLADFEAASGYSLGSLDGQLGWSVNQGSAMITAQNFFTGARSVTLSPGTVAQIDQAFGQLAGQAIVFADFYAKPQADTVITAATVFDVGSARFAFLLNGNGQGVLQAVDGDGLGGGAWTSLNFTISLGPGQQAQNWVRLTVRLDFTNKTWDLYANGAMVAFDLGFRDNTSTYLALFAMQGHAGGPTLFDDFMAGPANPVFADVNGNGIDDSWETAHGLSLSANNRYLSPSGNGVTVIQAYVGGSDPNDYFGGLAPTLTILSGDNQSAAADKFNAQPFAVAVLATDGSPLANAPVTFAVTQGGGLLGATNGTASLFSSLAVRTGSDGIARAFYRQPPAIGVNSQVRVTAGAAQAQLTTRTFPSGTMAIAAGSNHSLALKFDGTVWAWGNNVDGELGDGTTTGSEFPVQANGLAGVSATSGGGSHSLAVKNDGTVWAWGFNADGELGTGTITNSSVPAPVNSLTSMTAVAAGARHSLALKGDGTVWAWGYNADGELGDGGTTNSLAPVQVSGLTGITAIAAGALHSVALKSNGTVWAWGNNADGALGNGTTTNSSVPVQVPGLTGVIAIAAGGSHTLAVKSDGTVWSWGFNGSGQLGDGSTTDRATPAQIGSLGNIIAVAAGGAHCLALTSAGTVWAWGSDGQGQLGSADLVDRMTPIQMLGVTGIVAIAAGAHHSLLLKSDHNVLSFGDNSFGQLGSGAPGPGGADAPIIIATATNRAPTVSLTSPTSGDTFNAPANITITATASDLDGTIAKVEFYEGTAKLGEATQAPYSVTWTDGAAGSHTLAAKAYDNQGATAQSSPVAITIQAAAIDTGDTDANGLPDTWEIQYFGHLGVDPSADPDGDGLTNLEEYQLGRNPTKGTVSDANGAVNLRLYRPNR